MSRWAVTLVTDRPRFWALSADLNLWTQVPSVARGLLSEDALPEVSQHVRIHLHRELRRVLFSWVYSSFLNLTVSCDLERKHSLPSFSPFSYDSLSLVKIGVGTEWVCGTGFWEHESRSHNAGHGGRILLEWRQSWVSENIRINLRDRVNKKKGIRISAHLRLYQIRHLEAALFQKVENLLPMMMRGVRRVSEVLKEPFKKATVIVCQTHKFKGCSTTSR